MLPFWKTALSSLLGASFVLYLVYGILVHPQGQGFETWTEAFAEGGLYRNNSLTFEANATVLGKANRTTSVAIGMAITTKRAKQAVGTKLGIVCPIFKSLLPSFCRTASGGYSYRFYMAFDNNDLHLVRSDFRKLFLEAFSEMVSEHCPRESTYSLSLLRCGYSGRPAWAQNDAMVQAYLENADFYYRINDDTVMLTDAWTEAFIESLGRFQPPNVGVVGPNHHGGNMAILTYDFVHKTHIDIFGFYYPRELQAWYADRWMTTVYPNNCSLKLDHIRVRHTMENGQRYWNNRSLHHLVAPLIESGRITVNR